MTTRPQKTLETFPNPQPGRSYEIVVDAPSVSSTHARLTSGPRAAAYLTPAEARIVEAAAERIIPRTDTPGATEAHVADFADVMMAEWYPAAEAERFRAGIATLDATSRTRFGVAFAAATAAPA